MLPKCFSCKMFYDLSIRINHINYLAKCFISNDKTFNFKIFPRG